jgi:AraC family transcriptional regulator
MNERILQNPVTVDFLGIKLAGLVYNTTTRYGENFQSIPKFWKDYISSGKMQKLHNERFVKDHVEYGIYFREDPRTGNFEYFLGLDLGEEDAPDYTVRELLPAHYSVFSSPPADTPDFPAAIYNTWAFIFGDWLPKSGREIDRDFPVFERFDERVWHETGKVCDIYIPLRPVGLTRRKPPR